MVARSACSTTTTRKDAKGDFLREVRQRACDLFDVTLGPDYNAAHKNHFHLDVGGDHACR